MSSFTKPLVVEVYDNGRKFKLKESFTYYREDNNKEILEVPEGFVTDFCSIPRIFWSIYPPTGGGTKRTSYGKCGVLHDAAYQFKWFDRKGCDKLFLEAMKAMGVGYITRYIFYWSVRLFGRSRYGTE